MAVLIPDMKMPEACCACPCNYDNICAVNMQAPTFEEWYERRPDWCPLVEVPSRPKYDAQLLKDCGMEE